MNSNQIIKINPKNMTLSGYISEVRISNYARWVSSFVSPIDLTPEGCLEVWETVELEWMRK